MKKELAKKISEIQKLHKLVDTIKDEITRKILKNGLVLLELEVRDKIKW